MNQQELEKLRSMSYRDIILKYFPMLNDGRITSKQYSWILSQASPYVPGDPPAEVVTGVEEVAELYQGHVVPDFKNI